jgi:hypothetical protein
MQKWEYKQAFSRPRIEQLNTLGDDGWELVAIHGDTFIFKRPIDPQPQVVNNTYNTYTTTMPTHPIDWHLPRVIC